MQIVKSSQASAVSGFLVVGFGLPLYLLLLSGFPTIDALKVCAMIFVQIVSGALIWAQVMHPRQVDIIEGVGMGLAIGSIFAVIGHQLFLPTSLKDFGWLLPVVVAAITSVTWRATKGSHKNFALENVSGLFFVAFAVVLILKQWWWLLPLALPTGLALYLLSDQGRGKLDKILKPCWLFVAVSFVAVSVLMIYLRQLNLDWWIRSWDVVYHESKSFSIAKFGPNENISLVGYSMNYHWFGIAWIGVITLINHLPSWLSVTQVSPVYSAITIGCVFRAISSRYGKSLIYPIAISIIFVFATDGLSTANPPNVVAIMWALCALFVASEFIQSRETSFFLVFTLLGFAAFSGKVSAGFVVIAGFVLSDFLISSQVAKQFKKMLQRAFLLFVISVLSFLFVIGGPNRLGNNTFRPSLKGLGFVYGVEIDRSYIIFALGAFGLLLAVFKIILPILLVSSFHPGNRGLYSLVLAVLFFGLLPTAFLIDDAIFYFQINSLNLVSVGTGIALVTLLFSLWNSKQVNTRLLTVLFTLSVLLGFVTRYFSKINWREATSNPGGPTPILVLIEIFFLASCAGLAFFIVKPVATILGFRRNTYRLFAFSFLALAGTVIPKVFDTGNQFLQNIKVDGPYSIYVGSRNMIEASNWLKLNSKQDDVLATNKFCLEKGTNKCIDPKFFGVSATTQRRMLVEGPYYVVGGPYFSETPGVTDESKYPEWVQERLNLSRGFADKPTSEIAARLRELGVDWFYLFLDNTENRNWAPFATVEYQNSEVAILKLTDPSS